MKVWGPKGKTSERRKFLGGKRYLRVCLLQIMNNKCTGVCHIHKSYIEHLTLYIQIDGLFQRVPIYWRPSETRVGGSETYKLVNTRLGPSFSRVFGDTFLNKSQKTQGHPRPQTPTFLLILFKSLTSILENKRPYTVERNWRDFITHKQFIGENCQW